MVINNTFLDDNLPDTLKHFITSKYNNLTPDKRKELILKLADTVCKSCNVAFSQNDVFFINNSFLSDTGALFDYNKNLIFLNEDFLNKNLKDYEMAIFLDHIIHESIHYCQKQKLLFIEDLKLTLPFPYDLLQQNEVDAYSISDEILMKYKHSLGISLSKELENISDFKDKMRNACIINLFNRLVKQTNIYFFKLLFFPVTNAIALLKFFI